MQGENKQLYKLLDFISIAVGQTDKYYSTNLDYEHQKYLFENFGKSSITTVENLKNKVEICKVKLEKTRKNIREIYSKEPDSASLKKYYDLFNEYEKSRNDMPILAQEINKNSDILRHDAKCNKEEVSKNINSLQKKYKDLYKNSFNIERNLLNEVFHKMNKIENEQL